MRVKKFSRLIANASIRHLLSHVYTHTDKREREKKKDGANRDDEEQ